MSQKIISTTLDILGKAYPIKCPEHEVELLQKAAKRLEQKMQDIRASSNIFQLDSLAVIAALSLSFELVNIENNKSSVEQQLRDRLLTLEKRLDQSLPSLALNTAEA